MKTKTEKIGAKAAVKGTMVEAHLAWAAQKHPGLMGQLPAHLGPDCARFVSGRLLATDWVPFRCLVAIDRAIAQAAGGSPEEVFYQLGRHSALQNLAGVYKNFVAEEPHRFFEQMALLHSRFQNFGRTSYEKTGERTGHIRQDAYEEYSPVYCASGRGYYEGALHMMKVPGPIRSLETSCQCAGEPACLYELSW